MEKATQAAKTQKEENPLDGLAPTSRKKKKSPKRLIVIAVTLAVAGAGIYFILQRSSARAAGADNASAAALTEYTVDRGDITSSITGSGSVEPKETYNVVTTASGDIVSDYFSEDDMVGEGDLLYSIDSEDVQETIRECQDNLAAAQEDYAEAAADLSSLNVIADSTGVVTQVYVQDGDYVSEHAKIADLVDTSNLVLTIPFLSADTEKMHIGQSAQVTLSDSGAVVSGEVTEIYSGSSISALGAQTTKVEILFQNPGAVISGADATATVGGAFACHEEGDITYLVEDSITASATGEITGFDLKAGDAVHSGQVICYIENETAKQAVETAQDAVEAAQTKLENAQDSMESYELTAPISGTVIEKNVKAGDKLTSNDGTTMATIADMSELIFTISVDELEISYLKEGQAAIVTADAYEGVTYEGVVTNVSTIGTASNGVTTYPVTISISDYGELMPGMNVNAEIILDSAKNVLMVPIDAVTRGNFVLVRDEAAAEPAQTGGQSSGFMGAEAPAGYRYVEVEIGLSSDEFVEIKSGLTEGDIVGYVKTSDDGSMSKSETIYMTEGMSGKVVTGGAMPAGRAAPGGGF